MFALPQIDFLSFYLRLITYCQLLVSLCFKQMSGAGIKKILDIQMRLWFVCPFKPGGCFLFHPVQGGCFFGWKET